MPERKICVPGMSAVLTAQSSTISAAAVSITIWMIGVTESGSKPPPSAGTSGRRSLAKPKMQISATAPRKVATVPAHHERHREDADDAGRNGDQEHVDELVVVDLDEREDRRHRGCDRT